MSLHQEFKVNPIASALLLLEKAEMLREDNIENIKAFLSQGIPHADKLALALIELKFVKSFIQLCMFEIKAFLVQNAEHADIYARMLALLFGKVELEHGVFRELQEFLSVDYKDEIKNSIMENPQYAAQLTLTKIKLKTASPLIQEYLPVEDLVQHAKHAIEIFKAMERLDGAGFLNNEDNIQKLKNYLFQYGEYAYAFALRLNVFASHHFNDGPLLDRESDFFTSHIMQALLKCPPQNCYSFSCGMVSLSSVEIVDEENINILLNSGKNAVYVGKCLEVLKRVDERQGKLFNYNKLSIIKHQNESKVIAPMMEALACSKKIDFNQDNLDMIFRYIKFGQEIINVINRGANQTELDQFIKEIDDAVALQREPFLDGWYNKFNTNGIGFFFHAPHADPNLCETIFNFLPKTEVPFKVG